jgi:antitoxin component YwqK of YwqJK toxin-antitoxin module
MKNEEHYTKNVLDGTYTTYHENGKKQEEGSYKMGRVDGEKKAWNENGKLIATANYVNGEFESGQSY